MKSLIPLADIMKVSDEELAPHHRRRGPGRRGQGFAGQGVSLVVVTQGRQGLHRVHPGLLLCPAHLRHPGKGHHRAPGDSFFGALLAQVILSGKKPGDLSQQELSAFVDFANAAGSTCATKTGAIPAMPTTAEIEACQQNVPLLKL